MSIPSYDLNLNTCVWLDKHQVYKICIYYTTVDPNMRIGIETEHCSGRMNITRTECMRTERITLGNETDITSLRMRTSINHSDFRK